MSRRVRLVLSALCGVLALAISSWYVGHVRSEAQEAKNEAIRRYGGEVVTLAVASRTIEAGEVVSAGDVSMCDWVSSLAPKDAVTSLEDAVGREVSVPVAEGAPLTSLNFREASSNIEIPAGHVAISVPVTEKLGISSSVPEGSHISAYKAVEGSSEVICGDVVVLSTPNSAGTISGRSLITIAVDAACIAPVLSASTSGDLRLVMPADDVKQSTTNASEQRDVAPVSAEGQTKDQAKGQVESVDSRGKES